MLRIRFVFVHLLFKILWQTNLYFVIVSNFYPFRHVSEISSHGVRCSTFSFFCYHVPHKLLHTFFALRQQTPLLGELAVCFKHFVCFISRSRPLVRALVNVVFSIWRQWLRCFQFNIAFFKIFN